MIQKKPRAMLATMALLTIAVCAASACSSDNSHPPGIDTAENGASGRSNEIGAAGSHNETGGAGGSVGDDEHAGASGSLDRASAVTSSGPARCSEANNWSGAQGITSVSSSASESLLSVTADELDLAFLRAGELFVAHRATPSATFAIGSVVSVPEDWDVSLGAALSPDGLRLVLISENQRTLGELVRATRGGAFAEEVSTDAFAGVNQTAVYTGNLFASPALAPDDQELFYNSAPSNGGSSTVVVSSREGDGPWGTPARVLAALDGGDTTRRLPSGVSADGRTLFYFNEESLMEEARWRQRALLPSPFTDEVDLGSRRGAQPNAACDRLYSTSLGDIVVEHD